MFAKVRQAGLSTLEVVASLLIPKVEGDHVICCLWRTYRGA